MMKTSHLLTIATTIIVVSSVLYFIYSEKHVQPVSIRIETPDTTSTTNPLIVEISPTTTSSTTTTLNQRELGGLDRISLVVLAPSSRTEIILSNNNILYTSHPTSEGCVYKIDSFENVVGVYCGDTRPSDGMQMIQESRIANRAKMNKLVRMIKNSNFMGFDDEYLGIDGQDASMYILSIEWAKYSNTVSCYQNCPEPVQKIINQIREVWGEEIIELGV